MVVTSVDIEEKWLVADGTTQNNVTISWNVDLAVINPSTFTTKIYWSIDSLWDTSDQDSGKIVII